MKTPRQDNTSELGKVRLEAIRERMGMTLVDFARLLHVHQKTYRSIQTGALRCRTAYVELAELKLKEFIRKEKRQLAKKAAEAAKIEAAKPYTTVEIETDPAMKVQVIRLYIRGADKASIASALALRPAVVDHYLKGLENIGTD